MRGKGRQGDVKSWLEVTVYVESRKENRLQLRASVGGGRF